MDRWMPVLDGFETTRQMRQRADLKDIPVIAISASVSEEDQAQGYVAGINAFLPKPINWPNLVTLLEEHLGLEWESLAPARSAGDEFGKQQDGESAHEIESLIPPPQDEIAILHDLALRGDMRGIREQAAYIEVLGEQYVPFASRLRELAIGFEEREIIALVEQYL
jgi:DNA-binding NarL/FixJ family response regulator